MALHKIKRRALDRGTAVHLGGAKVRFVWSCGCTKVETLSSPVATLSEGATAMLVRNWRKNGVVLEECSKHPTQHNKLSQLTRLNAEHPQKELVK